MRSCSYCDHVMGGVCPAHQRRFANAVAAEIQQPADLTLEPEPEPEVAPDPEPEPESDKVHRRRK